MSALELELKTKPDQRLDLSPLVPSKLGTLNASEIEKLSIGTTRRPLLAGDVFKVKAGDAGSLRLVGTDERCDRIGHLLTEGEIIVDGDVGAYLGARMKKGKITISGSAGPFAAAGVKGGSIDVKGNVGERAGGVVAGDTFGMQGGRLVVGGNAGAMLGERMRRGQIIIGGDAGDYAGARVIAGTIIFQGGVGRWPGYGLRRGTLIFLRAPKEIPPTFVECGTFDFTFLRLMERQFAADGLTVPLGYRARRYMGDMAIVGKGEMLVLA